MNKEQMLAFNEATMNAFKASLTSCGGTTIPFGGNIMPRATWALCMTKAAIAVGVVQSEEQATKLHAMLLSELGNSSQLGGALVKSGFIVQQAKADAAISFADAIAEAAAAK